MRTDWHDVAKHVDIPWQLFIGGRWQQSRAGDRLDVVSPLDGRLVKSICAGDEHDVDLAVAAARRSFEDGV